MTDFMHAHEVAYEMGRSQEPPETRHRCTVAVFMTLFMAPIVAGVFGLVKLIVDHPDALGRWFLIFASTHSLASFAHFLWKIGNKALEKGDPHVDRLLVRFIRCLDAFFGRRSWCNRRLQARDAGTLTTARQQDPEPVTRQPDLA